MFIITVLAAFCCCLRLCIPQATRLPYRDLADSYVVFLALNSERPNTRGPPSSVRTSAGFPAYSMLHPVSVAVGVNRDGGIAPRRKPCASKAQGFRPAHECARTIPPSAVGAFRASFPENDTTVPAGSAGSLFRRDRPASGMSSSLHSSTARMK